MLTARAVFWSSSSIRARRSSGPCLAWESTIRCETCHARNPPAQLRPHLFPVAGAEGTLGPRIPGSTESGGHVRSGNRRRRERALRTGLAAPPSPTGSTAQATLNWCRDLLAPTDLSSSRWNSRFEADRRGYRMSAERCLSTNREQPERHRRPSLMASASANGTGTLSLVTLGLFGGGLPLGEQRRARCAAPRRRREFRGPSQPCGTAVGFPLHRPSLTSLTDGRLDGVDGEPDQDRRAAMATA